MVHTINKIISYSVYYLRIVEVCEAENDKVWNIAWPDTPFGSSTLQKCPGLSESVGE